MTLVRSLSPGPWGYVTYAAIALAYLIVIALGLGGAVQDEMLLFIGAMFVIPAAGQLRMRIKVFGDAIEYRPNYWYSKRVGFNEIAYGQLRRVETFGKRYRPVSLDLYRPDSAKPAMTIWLMTFRPADTDWLLDLPQLRVVRDS